MVYQTFCSRFLQQITLLGLLSKQPARDDKYFFFLLRCGRLVATASKSQKRQRSPYLVLLLCQSAGGLTTGELFPSTLQKESRQTCSFLPLWTTVFACGPYLEDILVSSSHIINIRECWRLTIYIYIERERALLVKSPWQSTLILARKIHAIVHIFRSSPNICQYEII